MSSSDQDNVRRERTLPLQPSAETASSGDLLLQRGIRQAQLAARKAGLINAPLERIPSSELDAPIVVPDEGVDDDATLPEIHGYLVMSKVGAGGQAVVYKAVQESTGRKVAIKVIAGGQVASARSRARFEREAEILATLDHPNIVSIVDRGRTADGSFFIAVQFIDGLSLDEHLKSVGRQPRVVLPLLVKVADAVGEAHLRGIVHRDIKPSNILVDARGEPHVTDFGLARLMDDEALSDEPVQQSAITRTGQILGSLPWLSPEQARGAASRLDTRSDVYALGVVCYHALTGRFPYPVEVTPRELLTNIETIAPQPPSASASGITAALDSVVLKALAKSPASRYADARELLADLTRVMEGRCPAAVADRPPSSRWLWLLTFGLVALAGASAILLVDRRNAGSLRSGSTLAPALDTSIADPVIDTRIDRRTQDPNTESSLVPLMATNSASPSVPALDAGMPNSIGMRFVRLPPGEFRMGSPKLEAGRSDNEATARVIIGAGLLMSEYEVTRGQYETVMRRTEWDPQRSAPDLPADNITWQRGVEFCAALSASEGRRYRLPTEAEWEYACRAGTRGAYGGSGVLDEMGWHRANAENQIHRVGTRTPNAWGLYDMHGNVFEWCSDHYVLSYPTQIAQGSTSPQSFQRVLRGGSIESDWKHCRSANRTPRDPAVAGRAVGFRVVLDQRADRATD
jgi:serine/threonine protein kinase